MNLISSLVPFGALAILCASTAASGATTFGSASFTGFASGSATRLSDNTPLTGFNNNGPFGSVANAGGGGSTSGGIGDGSTIAASLELNINVNQIGSGGDGGFLVDFFGDTFFDPIAYSGSVSAGINASPTVSFSGSQPFQAFIARTGSIGSDDVAAITLLDQNFNPVGSGLVMLSPGVNYTLQINANLFNDGNRGGNVAINGAFVLTIPAPGASIALLGALAPALLRRRRAS